MTAPRLVLALFLCVGCAKEPTPEPPPIRPVRTTVAEQSGGTRTRTFSGVAAAGQQSRLSFRVPGTVKMVHVKVGDKVKSKTIIAELDATDYELQVQQARAARASAQAQGRDAKAKYDQVQALFENQNASKRDLDSARAMYETARANASASSKQVALAMQQLSYTKLRAPVDGEIANVAIEANEAVQAGRPVATITSGSRPEVTISVPGVLIRDVKADTPVSVQFDALPGKTFAGTVTEVGVVAAQATFPVTVVLDEDSGAEVRPGMAADVQIKFVSERKKAHYLLPPHAVGEDNDGRFVFVVEKSQAGRGQVKRTSVVVGEFSDGGIEILEGIKDGDIIVTAGVSRIQDGLEVKLLPRVKDAQ